MGIPTLSIRRERDIISIIQEKKARFAKSRPGFWDIRLREESAMMF